MALSEQQRGRVEQLRKQDTISSFEAGYLQGLCEFWQPNVEDKAAIAEALTHAKKQLISSSIAGVKNEETP